MIDSLSLKLILDSTTVNSAIRVIHGSNTWWDKLADGLIQNGIPILLGIASASLASFITLRNNKTIKELEIKHEFIVKDIENNQAFLREVLLIENKIELHNSPGTEWSEVSSEFTGQVKGLEGNYREIKAKWLGVIKSHHIKNLNDILSTISEMSWKEALLRVKMSENPSIDEIEALNQHIGDIYGDRLSKLLKTLSDDIEAEIKDLKKMNS